MLFKKEGGYKDMTAVEDFYAFFRGIFNSFWEMVTKIAKALGIDVEEGKGE